MKDSRPDILPIIDRLSFFDTFTANEKRQMVSEDTNFRVYHPGERLIRKGSNEQSLFIILTGTVIVQGAGETTLAVLRGGDILGEMGFLTDTRRTANVIAREAVIALKLDRTVFDQLPAVIREKFKDRIIQKLATRLEKANAELIRLSAAVEHASPKVKPLSVGANGPAVAKMSGNVFTSGRDLIRRIVADTDALPAMPEVIVKVQQIINLPGTTPAQLAKIIQSDPSLVAGLLKVANSAFYGFRGKVATIQHASTLLGTRRLGELITAMSAGDVLGQAIKGYGLKAGDMWRHSIAVAFTAAEIAAAIGAEAEDSAYMAGLLHDMGKLVLDPYIRQRKLLFEHYYASNPGKPVQDAERAILGFDHAVMAAIICETWHLPRAIAFGIRHHHRPSSAGDHQLSHIVHLADYAAIQAGMGSGSRTAMPVIDETCRSMLPIDADMLTQVTQKALKYVDSIAGMVVNA